MHIFSSISMKTFLIIISFFTLFLVAVTCSPEDGQEQASSDSNHIRDSIESDVSNRGESLLRDAEQAANTGDNPLARRTYQQAITIFEETADTSGLGRAFLGLGNLERYSGQGAVARELYGRATEAFIESGEILGEANVAYALGELDRSRFNNNEALDSFKHAADIYNSQKQWSLEAHSLLGVGDIERRLRSIINSRDSIARAKAIFQTLGDDSGIRMADQAWEELFTYFDDYDEVRKQTINDLATAQQVANLPGEAVAALELGKIEVSAGRPDEARKNYNISQDIFTQLNDKIGIASVSIARATMEKRLGNIESSKKEYLKAESIYREIQQNEGIAIALIGLGSIKVLQQLDSTAEFSEAMEVVVHGQLPNVDAKLDLALGKVATKNGDFETSNKFFEKAIIGFKKTDNQAGIALTLMSLATLNRTQENISNAKNNYREALYRFIDVRDRIGEAEARDGLAGTLVMTEGQSMEAAIQYHIAASIFKELGLIGSFEKSKSAALEIRP